MRYESDAVFLEGMQFYAYHGVNDEEQVLGQRFVVDVVLVADLRAAGDSDDVLQTISYSAVYKRVRAIVEGPPRNLVETVAEEIARELLAEFPTSRVDVTVRKPAPPIRGALLDAVGVRIVRTRDDLTGG